MRFFNVFFIVISILMHLKMCFIILCVYVRVCVCV